MKSLVLLHRMISSCCSVMFDPISHPYLVPADNSFRYNRASTQPPKSAPSKKIYEKRFRKCIKNFDEWQRRFYAHDRYALLLIFQAMDAAGKDGTIRAVMRGVNPADCQVFPLNSHRIVN